MQGNAVLAGVALAIAALWFASYASPRECARRLDGGIGLVWPRLMSGKR